MTLSTLWAQDFRNFEEIDLTLSKGLNVITGSNGAGKTNLLELIYFLGRTRSFRTHKAQQFIRHGKQGCLVRGKVERKQAGPTNISVRRDHEGVHIRKGEQTVYSVSELVPWLPIQVITPDSHELLQGGPRFRRQYLDWGVFHVEQRFFPRWRSYSKALRQRNAALRARVPTQQVKAWDAELVGAAMDIHEFRSTYVGRLSERVKGLLMRFLGRDDVELEYRAGWAAGESLQDALDHSLETDRERGFTNKGPHRADLTVKIGGRPVTEWVSRGQQKAIVISMLLAQAQAYTDSTSFPSILLVDDLAAELDVARRAEVLAVLRESNAQVFLTSLELDSWPLEQKDDAELFHVERGSVTKMV